MTAYSDAITRTINSITPAGTRLDVVARGACVTVKVCCSGSNPGMGYLCCREPGHHGNCFSREKHVDFKRSKP